MIFYINDDQGNWAEGESSTAAGLAVTTLFDDAPDVNTIVVTRRKDTEDLDVDLKKITEEIATSSGLAGMQNA
jgi:hypothetical protein